MLKYWNMLLVMNISSFFKCSIKKYWIYFRVKLTLFSFLKVLLSTSGFSFELEDYTSCKSNIKHVGMSTAEGKASVIVLRRIFYSSHKVVFNCKGTNFAVHVFFAKESYLTKKPKSGNLS